ncbi:MAG: VOC family protein [Oscillospiraceae bacterium]|nr:VOC family protein [Oscillospiraceae bacterium]
MKLEVFAYVDGLEEAVVFYQSVFGAKINPNNSFKNDDGSYEICSFMLDDGNSFSLAERKGESAIEGEANTGNIIQLCMHYKKGDLSKLEKAYALLSDGANIRWPLQPKEWTSHTCDLIDKYGLRWCLMVWGE